MIRIDVDPTGDFKKQMNNLIKYTEGFLEGAQRGKNAFLKQMGESVKEVLENFIDSNARVNSEALHHVYEWYQAGNPDSRLFEISYTVSNLGLSFKSNFTQSKSIANGSNEPFFDKAKVMESGASITIRPQKAEFLRFEKNGDVVFTPNPVAVPFPGGASTTGGFEKTFDNFFQNYFKQSFLQSSGMRRAFSDVSIYKKNLRSGLVAGRSAGLSAGYRWITNVRMDKA
jgi:hypothetical protein